VAATRSPQEVFNHHAQALGAEDLDEIVADYSDDAIFITPAGVLRGKDGTGQVNPEGCKNAFMLLAGTRAGGHRAGRVDECRLADPHRRRSAGWVGLVLAARALGVGGVRCSARRTPEGPAPDAHVLSIRSQSKHSVRTVRTHRSA
jgi:hypothetical protein